MGHIALSDVHKSFDGAAIIKGVELDIADRELVVFVGPSGSGKSTLLRLIAGLEPVTSGRILIDGQDVTHVRPSKRGLAMVFQSYALYPHMSVRNNMAFSLRMAGEPRESIDRKVRKAAAALDLENHLDRKPRALSGGQRQRVAIGRAIVREPRAFLFDEPLSNLDAALRVKMRLELAKLHQDLDTTMIHVTHDQVEAMTLADRIVVLRDGAVEQVGSPLALYHHPANRFVAGFIGSPAMNFLEGRVVDTGPRGVELALDGDVRLTVPVRADRLERGEPLTLGVRPEHLRVGGDETMPRLTARVEVVERLGGVTYLYVHTRGGEVLTIEGDGDARIRVGETVRIGLDGARAHLFRADGHALESLEPHPLADTVDGTG